MKTGKSIWSIAAGFIFVVVISIATDITLERTGAMKMPFHSNPSWFIVLVIVYRTLYGMAGSYLTAALAPDRPMRHVMIGGGIGFAISITGSIIMRDEGPAWYAFSLIILALPTAWLGGTLRQLIYKS